MMLANLAKVFDDSRDRWVNRQLYLACSGGRDSLALAWACKLLHEQGKLAKLPILLHVHHGWQQANDDWADLVTTWAKAQGFECHLLKVQLTKHNETIARDMRYEALMCVMAEGDVLLLAHHANDQAETMLMRLINGTGVRGLSAMKSWQAKTCHNKSIWLWRPMLQMSRDTISQFAKAHQLPYVDDPTNHDDDYLRGKLRNHIMPVAKQINPQVIQNMARTSQLLAEADELIEMFITDKLCQAEDARLTHAPYCQTLSIDKVINLPNSAQSTLIHRWLGRGESISPNHRLVQDVLHLIWRTDNNHETRLFWQANRGYVISRYQGRLYRHRDDAWACLMAESSQLLVDEGYILKHTPMLNIIWRPPVEWMDDKLSIEPLTKDTKVPIRHKNLYGKKLVQTLAIPTWLRGNLWLIKVDGKPILMVTVGRAWRLEDGCEMSELSASFA